MKKKKIIIISLIWVIALGAAFWFATSQKRSENNKGSVQKESPSEKEEALTLNGISIYDTYEENDLNIVNKNLDADGNKNYIQISGLKNTEIENSINKRIKDKFDEYNTKYGQNKNVTINTNVTANFGDILSAVISVTQNSGSTGYTTIDESHFNISLKDGKDINFEDIFTQKDVINGILTKRFSYSISLDINSSDLSQAEKMAKDQQVEDIVYTIVQGINNGNGAFSLYSNGIGVSYDKYDAEIPLVDYAQYFAYPTRYKANSSLYKEDIKKMKLNYIDNYEEQELVYMKRDYVNDNAFVDAVIMLNDNSLDRNKIVTNMDVEKIVNDEINSINNKQFNYLNFSGYFMGSDFSIFELNYSVNTCTMSKDYFEKEMKKNIYLSKVSAGGEFSNITPIDTQNKNVNCSLKDKVIVLDKNYQVIQSLSDIFKNGYDYQSVIDSKFYEAIQYTDMDSEQVKSKLKYSINGSGIVYEYGDFTFTVDFTDFDRNGMKI